MASKKKNRKGRNSKGEPSPKKQEPDGGTWRRRDVLALIIAVLAWLFPDPLRLLPSPNEKKITADDPIRVAVHDEVKVTEEVKVTAPLTPSTGELQVIGNNPTAVVDTRLTPGTGTLRLGNVVASLDTATYAPANLVNATHATANAVNVIR